MRRSLQKLYIVRRADYTQLVYPFIVCITLYNKHIKNIILHRLH
nr:MAG TPA: hypothetical protein [Bacteriophage sp.]